MSAPMGIGEQIQRRCLSQWFTTERFHRDGLFTVRVHHQQDAAIRQWIGDLKALPQVGDCAVLAHFALHSVIEQFIEVGGIGAE